MSCAQEASVARKISVPRCCRRSISSGLRDMAALAEQGIAEYDTIGWTDPSWISPRPHAILEL